MKKFIQNMLDIFKYTPENNYNFNMSPNTNQNNSDNLQPLENLDNTVYTNLNQNLKYLKSKYNQSINSDIKIRDFYLVIKNVKYKAFLIYIDGMSDTLSINKFIMQPLMKYNSFNTTNPIIKPNIKKLNNKNENKLADFVYSNLIPQNDIVKSNNFKEIISSINLGNCGLFIDSINTCFICDVKGFEKRNINSPKNENVIRGSQEAFVEAIRTNTSIIRRLVNNENLIIEDTTIGKISQTKCAICYLKDVANDSLVDEIKYRINNIDIDYILSSGQLEELLKEHSNSSLPETLSTERPDRVAKSILNGKVAILVNGTPICLVAPCVFLDLLETVEDYNINFKFANLLKFVRLLACFISILLPGLYIAITGFHEELIPTELLFSIISSRQAVPIPIALEILIMEVAFELIHEAGIRVPSPISSTMSIVGALVLGDAAVSANIVSPISIIIVAISGLTSFAVPNFTLELHFRILKFIFIFLGLIFGFLGISLGLFIYIGTIANYSSFSVPYLAPYVPLFDVKDNGYFLSPIWKQEKRNDYLKTKRKYKQSIISMKWKK